jgi:hypothetical protein
MGEFFAPLPAGAPPEPIAILVTSSAYDNSPGPGGYSGRKDILSGVTPVYMHTRRPERTEVNQAPFHDSGPTIGKGCKGGVIRSGRRDEPVEYGPGCDYAPAPFGSNTRAVKLGGGRTEAKIPEGPGPGQYDSPRGKIGVGSCKTSTFKGPRDRSPPVGNMDSPGAGSYCPEPPKTTRSVIIGRRWESRNVEVTPGPGQYKDPNAIGNRKLPGGLIQSRVERSVYTDGPGPGEYCGDRSILAGLKPVYMHSRTERKVETNQAGFLDLRSKGPTGPKFTMRSRPRDPVGESTPASEYVPAPLGSGARAVAIGGRVTERKVESGPGPGAYQPKSARDFGKGRAATMRGPGRRIFDKQEVYGPSSADYNADTTSIKGPKFSIKGGRYEPKPDRGGEYVKLGSTLTGPKWTMKPRTAVGVCYK